ncbi:MAG: CsgG/HfaB family protein [Thermodesulfovibrionales bacterium]|nr:CsgG/HfaB family protein [Thermodesulfovibrionales bacterium]
MEKIWLSTVLLSTIFLSGCITLPVARTGGTLELKGPQIDPTAYIAEAQDVEKIPDVCKAAYESGLSAVAVANFTNNTTFDYARIVQESIGSAGQRKGTGGAVAVGGGIVWGEREKAQFEAESQKIQREVNAKLSESVEDGIINELVNMGGARVYTRSEINKILSEKKFQLSGIVDDATLVKIGKLVGVKYILTGSINNVNLSYKSYEEAKETAKTYFGIFGGIAATAMAAQEGWHITTDIAIRLLDVETGQILLSQLVNGTEHLGKLPYPNYDALIGGVKKASQIALETPRPQLSKYFTVKGYILQTKTSPDGKEKIALVNVGEKQGLRPGFKMLVYTFQEIKDPFTGKVSCDRVKLPVDIVVTNQIQDDKAWVIIGGDINQVKRIKAGNLIERAPIPVKMKKEKEAEE